MPMFQSLYHPVFALAAFAVAVLSSRWLLAGLPLPAAGGRFATIDGLRGYLAFSVFVHHASIWYAHVRTGLWELPPSALYMHLGQSAVALFFMITGFLFFGQLLRAREQGLPVDWLRLYASRVLRLCPLYLLVVVALLLCVLAATQWQLQVSVAYLLRTVAHWLFFTIAGAPTINAFDGTPHVVAGVVWSLPYEWAFYLLLPLVALCIGLRPRWPWLVLAAVCAVGLWFRYWLVVYGLAFGAGIAAAWLARHERFRALAGRPWAGVVVLACGGLAGWASPSARDAGAMLWLGAGFCLIAAGNDLFGLLRWRASRQLGEVAYSLYLLHGLLLFVMLRFGLSQEFVLGLSVAEHWLLMLALVPLLVGLAGLSYVGIERPALRRVDALASWLRPVK